MDTTRYSGLFDLKDITVNLFGVGGIGSWAALALAKSGVKEIHVYDPDKVSSVNVATQLYGEMDINLWKTHALDEIISRFADTIIHPHVTKVCWDGFFNLPNARFNISAVDSIQARKDIWPVVLGNNWQWYLDVRMSAMSLTIHVVNENETEWYEMLLGTQDDKFVPDEPCTSKATPFTGMIIGGLVADTVVKLYTGKKVPKVLCMDLNTMRVQKI